jgi:ABC-type sugar transport system ATPase subunit
MLGIGELLHRYPRELSGGQRQRVALGRTLIRKPKVYLFDEPIAHLDAKLRHRMRSELKKIQLELGVTTLYATPDQLEALSMADTVAVLNKGVVEQIGTPDELYYRPVNLYVAAFLCDPAMNVFDAEYGVDHVSLDCGTPCRLPLSGMDLATLSGRIEGRRLKVGIRPVDMRLVAPQDGQAHLRGEVTLIDTLGQTSIVTAQVGSVQIKAKVASDVLPERHSAVGLALDPARLFFFDALSQRRL